MTADVTEITTKDALIAELQAYLSYALEWIDAVPKAAIADEAMPGFGRDEAEALIAMRPDELPDPGPGLPGA